VWACGLPGRSSRGDAERRRPPSDGLGEVRLAVTGLLAYAAVQLAGSPWPWRPTALAALTIAAAIGAGFLPAAARTRDPGQAARLRGRAQSRS
jgi:hypothetical protein